MGLFGGTDTKEQLVGLTPHGRECLETDSVELNHVEQSVMWYLKENSAKGIKDIARGIDVPYPTVKYAVFDLVRKRLVEYIG